MQRESEGRIIMLLVASGFSFFSTLLIILYYLIKRKALSSYSFELVLMLCVSDFFFSLVHFFRSIWMLVDPEAYLSDTGCQILGIYIQTWMMSSFLCTSTIQYSIYKKVIKGEQIHKQSALKQYWMINYLAPFISGIILFSSNSIGHQGPFESTFCFINSDNETQTEIMMIVFYYFPYLSVLTYNSIAIGYVVNYYRKLREEQTNLAFQEYLKLLAYPIILFICFFPVVLTRILNFYDIKNDTVLSIAFCVDNLIGFFNSLIYFLFSLNPCQIVQLKRFQSFQEQNNSSIKLQFSGDEQSYIQKGLIEPDTRIVSKIRENKQSSKSSDEWSI